MFCHARVVFEGNTSVAEMHPDVSAALQWIELERQARPASFRLGQVVGSAPDHEIIATCNTKGWHQAVFLEAAAAGATACTILTGVVAADASPAPVAACP